MGPLEMLLLRVDVYTAGDGRWELDHRVFLC